MKAAGSFVVDDGFLVLDSPFGETRVALGLQAPRKLASRLLKNICTRASEDAQSCVGPAVVIASESEATQGS